ncbi:hypothetical protein VTO42DRAFT_3798 [Malbranchea cinnamomea]
MKSLLLVALNAVLFVTGSLAWTFVWHDADGHAHVELGTSSQECTRIEMPKGKQYKWDPEDSEYCISLFADDECETRNGWSCLIWGPRNLGQPWVRSFLVNKEDGVGDDEITTIPPTATGTGSGTRFPSSSSSSSSEPTANSTASRDTGETVTPTTLPPDSASATQASPTTVSTAVATETTEPQADGGGSALSGGEIAGVVVGTCAGVGIMATFGLLAYRRRRAKAAQLGDDGAPSVERGGAAPPPPRPDYPELDSQPASPITHPPHLSAAAPIQPQTYNSEKGEAMGDALHRPHVAELPDTSLTFERLDSHGKQV